ncbi:acetyl-CoA synthetase-like protein [Thelephora ganbajun]|uniref:Acetyl-CoA synthetase-like protein n=1 Tax=Thelephora ganbajun TaxID=370292 RepID=A0ACB6ZI10_THEGA|nr:acetyl-CoA synthetase-like protein [Thelephora ganbajun]
MSQRIPAPPLTQALISTTFVPPPLDLSLTTAEIIDFHRTHSPNHVAYVYEDAPGECKEITYSTWTRAIHRAARYVRNAFQLPEPQIGGVKPIVSMLANSDTITYATTELGIIRAENAAFPVSLRNSASAVAHLIGKTGSKYLIVTPDFMPLTDAAIAILREKGSEVPAIQLMPAFKDLFPDDDSEDFEYLPEPKLKGLDDPVLILHSSGSVAFPKPITFTNRIWVCYSRLPYHGGRDFCGVVFGAHAVSTFHGMGMNVLMFMTGAGITSAVFKPAYPPTIPVPDVVYAGAVATKSDVIFCVPMFVETWAKDPAKVEHFKAIRGLLFAGAPLKKSVGDYIVSQGVNVFQLYGSTEMGTITETLPKEKNKEWEWFKFSPSTKAHFIPDGNGAYELLVESTPTWRTCVENTKIGDAGGYLTGDLLIPHPTLPGYWKVLGRADDQLMHNTGEKTNPVPLEAILNGDPYVKHAVMFGRGRFNPGVIIDPKPEFAFDPEDKEKLAEFRNKIWPTVERMNEYAPQHSRLFKEMILVSSPKKPFDLTAKLTVRRQIVTTEYESEIDALYEAVNEAAQVVKYFPNEWTEQTSLEFARNVVGSVLKVPVKDGDDIFQNTCDSLQATWIRNSVLNALKNTTKLNTREISSNFVYQNPTVSALGKFIYQFTSTGVSQQLDNTIKEMKDMVGRYIKDFPAHKPVGGVKPQGDVILITGTTGAIGSNTLAELYEPPNVTKIFVLARSSSTPISTRQKKALVDRGRDPSIVDSPKVTLLEGDPGLTSFGLSDDVFSELKSTVTHILHIGWRVDFNLSVLSFETNVAGVRNLVDFALESKLPTPPRVVFISTVAVIALTDAPGLVPERPATPESATLNGYSQSKWVSEQVLQLAAEETSLRPVIIRVGQVSGGINGSWNPLEWIPGIVQSAGLTKSLPSMGGKLVSLIPLQACSQALVQALDTKTTSPVLHLHLVNPTPSQWDSIFGYVAEKLDVSLVPFTRWLPRLKEASTTVKNPQEHSALHLLEFYESLGLEGRSEVGGLPSCNTEVSRSVCPVLRELTSAKAEEIQGWLDYWGSLGLLKF